MEGEYWLRRFALIKASKKEQEIQWSRIAETHKVIVSCCCYCGVYLGVKDPEGARYGMSHGMCDICLAAQKEELRQMRERKAQRLALPERDTKPRA
jgi:hypothetical protein